MKQLRNIIWGILLVISLQTIIFGQTTSSISGTITDQNQELVAGAAVTIKNEQSGVSYNATTTDNGTFTVPALPTGTYQVTVSANGFKQSVVDAVKLDVGVPATVNVSLEVGAATEVVNVTSEAEILNTQNANVSSTIVGRQIVEQPQASRDALDLVLFLPGVQTTGRPRTSTINGLPKGALNITIDGVDVQDNLISSNDGFFTYVRPRVDAIQEVTVSTATPGAESSGEGAAQIKFVTQRGTNDYRGGLYWYHRQPSLNANYFFNNQDLAPDPVTGKAPRNPIRLNQYGGKFGGPLPFLNFGEGGPIFNSGKDRSFFFVNYEEFKLVEQQLRNNRVVLTPDAQTGFFTYGTNRVNLFQLAANNGFTSTVDPTISGLLTEIRNTLNQGSLSTFDANRQIFSYLAPAKQNRSFLALRFDFNLSKNHQLENITNYQKFATVSGDFLNASDPAFPGFPTFSDSLSTRYSNSTALRSTITSNLINEARFAYQGGPVSFGPLSPSQFANQNGVDLTFGFGLTDATYPGARTFGTGQSRRSTPFYGFTDNLTWIRGNHTLNFGGGYNEIRAISDNDPQVVPIVTLGVVTGDPVTSLFTTANFPGASTTDLANAAALYALLTGRVSGTSRNAYLNDGNFNLLGSTKVRFKEKRFSLYAQDSWRARPNLTVTGGLRWEPAFPVVSLNSNATRTTYEGLFGVSGVGNLFMPGTLTGQPTQFTVLRPGEKLYATDYNNFAPSISVAYSPSFENGLLKSVFGGNGETVFRGGYSMAFVREGLSNVSTVSGANPGATLTVNRQASTGTLPFGSLLRDPSTLQAPNFPTTATFPFPGNITDAAFGYDPDLRTGIVHSWTFGIQRALSNSTALEVRYVGTRADDLWRRVNLNEVNVVENNFLREFQAAQANFFANRAAGRGNTFAYFGPGTGTNPLPTILGYFSGLSGAAANSAANYTSSFFANSSFFNTFSPNNASPLGFAGLLNNNPALFSANRAAAGIPVNFFVANPGKLGGSSFTTNGIDTSYHALQIELRRRLSRGLLVQANYTFSKSLTNAFASSQTVFSQPLTLRESENERLESFRAPQDITHAFKASWIYELPFGNGQSFFGNANRLLNALIGGFEFHGTARVQSGRPFSFGNVQLVGMTREELQKEIKIRKNFDRTILTTLPRNAVIFLPEDIILNTARAFNTSVTSATGFATTGSVTGPPTGRYIAPANSNGCVQAFTGQCGFSNLIVDGPMFTRFDLSLVKKIRFTERMNLEMRGEFLNAFNNINFMIGGSAAVDVAAVGGFANPAFGRVTNAYQDISTTNDPGGRLVQLVLRLNF